MQNLSLSLNQIFINQTHRRLDLQLFDKLEGETINGVSLRFEGVILRYYDNIFYFSEHLREAVIQMYFAEVEFIEDKLRRLNVNKCQQMFATWGGFTYKDGISTTHSLPDQLDVELSSSLPVTVPFFNNWVIEIDDAWTLPLISEALRNRTKNVYISPINWRFLW